ncbi:MAG: hypothetical protein JW844_06575 [Candidatus Omnitrophica bacterium]|nr:hypothetical protein [Candidatus Omnitrophota bacterium]
MAKVISSIVLFCAGCYFVIAQPVLSHVQGQRMTDTIETDKKMVKRFLLEGDIVPSRQLYQQIEAEQEAFEGYGAQLRKFLDPGFKSLPRGSESGLYFREALFALEKKLDREAKGAGIEIPKSLGFGTELPPVSEVPRLLKQLTLVEQVVTSFISEGATEISEIQLLELPAVDGQNFEEVPVEVRAVVSHGGLLRVLYALNTAQPAVDIRTLRVKRLDTLLEVDLTASVFLFNEAASETKL